MRITAVVLAVALCIAGAAPAAPTAPPARIPIEAFADEPVFDAPVLSPDGRRFAARAMVGGKSHVLVYDAALTNPARAIDLGGYGISSIDWAGNDRLVLRVLRPMTLLSVTLQVPRLVVIDLSTGAQRPIDEDSRGIVSTILHIDPAGGWLLVASQADASFWPSVKRIDLGTGAARLVEAARPGIGSWYADATGTVRAGTDYDGDRWTMWYRPDAAAPLARLRGRIAGASESGTVEGLYFLAGTGGGVIVTNARTGRFAAYHYDFRTGAIGAPVYENAEVDVSGVRIGDGGRLEGIAYTDDRDRVHWLDPARAKVQATVDRALPNAENILLSASRDGSRTILRSGSASDPGTYYLFDAPSRRLHPIVSLLAALDGVELATVKPVRYQARDGLSVPGYLTLPPGKRPRDLPLIVLPHGGPHLRDTWDYDPWVQFLANRGYAVLQPNFRGSTGYGREFAERGYGQWGRAMQDDIDDGVASLAAAGTIDPARVCLFGASYGGYAALWGAIRDPARYRCAASFAGVTDVPTMLRTDRRMFAAARYYRDWERKVRGVKRLDMNAISPLAQADRLTVPVLIAHGEGDTNVPVAQSRALAKALNKRHAVVETVFYPGEGHGLVNRANKIDFLKRLEAFLTRYNPS